jgi:hypothetical protein
MVSSLEFFRGDVIFDSPFEDVAPAIVNDFDPLNDNFSTAKETAKPTFIEDLVGRCTSLVKRIKTNFDNFILEVFSAIGAFFKMIKGRGSDLDLGLDLGDID